MNQNWFREQPEYANHAWLIRDLPVPVAKSAIWNLYDALSDYEHISGWNGPIFCYGGGFENHYRTKQILIRDGSLVMTIFATWCAAEEAYVLSPEIASQLRERLRKVVSQDSFHRKLLKIATFGLSLVIKEPNYRLWWKNDLWKFDRDSTWVLKEIVVPQLNNRKNQSGDVF